MAIAPSPNDLTRQQLDELDALLQRMLSLPLPTVDESAVAAVPVVPTAPLPMPDPVVIPAAVKNWRVDPPKAPPAPAPHLLVAPLPVEMPAPRSSPTPVAPPEPAKPHIPEMPRQVAPVPVTVPPPPAPVVPPPSPKAAPVVQVPPMLPAPVASLPFAEPVLEPEIPKPRVLAPQPVTPKPPPGPSAFAGVPVVLWPLVLINVLTDALFRRLGPVGSLLRSGLGKNALGLMGIALLMYTLAHIAQLRAWITLPFPLAWPH